MMKPKVGLITTMSWNTSWPDSMVDAVKRGHITARSALEGIGMEVVEATGSIARTDRELSEHAKELWNKGAEVFCVYVGCWTESSSTVNAACLVNLPVIVWADATPGQIGIVGAAIVRGALDEVGIPTTLVHGAFNDNSALKKLKIWCTGAAAVMRLKGTRLGVGGSRCMGMYTANVDPSEIKKKFGIDIDGWDEMELIDRSKEISDIKANEFYIWMERTYGAICVKRDVMFAQIKMYIALKELCRERGYDFLAVKCLPYLPACYTTFCIAHAMFNDMEDADGSKEPFVCACEADINGALSMQILKNISGKTTMFTDVLQIDRDDGIIRLCNCGSQPTDFAPSKKDVHWVTEGLREYKWKMGGVCPQYVAKAGKATFCRLGRIDGEYVMLIFTGTIVEQPREKLAELNSQQPQAFCRIDSPIDEFVENLRCNHVHMAYGEYTDELLVVCRILGIRPVLIGRR